MAARSGMRARDSRDMADEALTVVIPTRNRCRVLRSTLEALDKQRGVDVFFSVVVVDDGSTDDTPRLLQATKPSNYELKSIALEHGGPARARNAGIREAVSDRILLLGDDMIPEPDCLARHLSGEAEGGTQGMIDWDSESGVTEVMRFLAPEGPQFWFKGLETGSLVPWSSVVSSNLSAPRSWFLDEPFDEAYTDACLEDTEMLWRWKRRSRRVYFDGEAKVLHHHHYENIEPFLTRQRLAGWWARRAIRQHPDLVGALVLKPLALAPALAIRSVWRTAWRRGCRSDLWDLQCRTAFARGLISARRPSRTNGS